MPFNDIPKPGELVPYDAIYLKHAEYEARIDFWKFFRDSDELTGGYAAVTKAFSTAAGNGDIPSVLESYLIPHEKEDAYDFKRRVAAARPPHFVSEGIEGIVGVLTHRPASRVLPDKVTEWMGRVTREGASWNHLVSANVLPQLERYGVTYTLAKPPNVYAGTEAEAQALRDAQGLPKVEVVLVSPEALEWWETDEVGLLASARYVEDVTKIVYDGIWPTEEESLRRHWYLTRLGWWYVDEPLEGKDRLEVVESGYWLGPGKPMRHHPLSQWSLKDCRGPTESAAFAQVAYFRKESELSNLETATCFPMTWIPIKMKDENPEEIVKGPNIVGVFSDESKHVPLILQPDSGPFTHYQEKRLPAIADDCLAPYGRRRASGGDDSGRALQHIELQAQNIWRQHSEFCGESELRALRPVAEFLGEEITEEHRCQWPTDFGALSDEIKAKMLMDFAESAEPGPLYKEKAVRAWAGVAMPELTDADHDEAIEAMQKDMEERKKKEEEMMAEMDDYQDGMPKPKANGFNAGAKPSKMPVG
jgi:hypothetical protein